MARIAPALRLVRFNSHTEPARLPFCHRISDLPSVEIAYGGRMQARPGVAEIGAS